MSSALLRQALEFVDQQESQSGGDKARHRRNKRQTAGQGYRHLKKQKSKKVKEEKSKDTIIKENIEKLLNLSKPTVDADFAQKIVERAVKGKPLVDKVAVKKEEYKSILFADEEEASFEEFEKDLFCS